MLGLCLDDKSKGVAIDIISPQFDLFRCILISISALIFSHRCIVDLVNSDAHRRRIGICRSIVDLESEAVRPYETGCRGVGQVRGCAAQCAASWGWLRQDCEC